MSLFKQSWYILVLIGALKTQHKILTKKPLKFLRISNKKSKTHKKSNALRFLI